MDICLVYSLGPCCPDDFAMQNMLLGPAASPGSLLEMQNLRLCSDLLHHDPHTHRFCSMLKVEQQWSNTGYRLTHLKTKQNKKSKTLGVPWWPSRLKIWFCHCCGSGSIPGPGTSACQEKPKMRRKKKRRRKKERKKKKQQKQNSKIILLGKVENQTQPINWITHSIYI